MLKLQCSAARHVDTAFGSYLCGGHGGEGASQCACKVVRKGVAHNGDGLPPHGTQEHAGVEPERTGAINTEHEASLQDSVRGSRTDQVSMPEQIIRKQRRAPYDCQRCRLAIAHMTTAPYSGNYGVIFSSCLLIHGQGLFVLYKKYVPFQPHSLFQQASVGLPAPLQVGGVGAAIHKAVLSCVDERAGLAIVGVLPSDVTLPTVVDGRDHRAARSSSGMQTARIKGILDLAQLSITTCSYRHS